MASTRISMEAKEALKMLARKQGKSMQSILDEAVEVYRRKVFLDECNRAYAALRANEELWVHETDERLAWDSTLTDDRKES